MDRWISRNDNIRWVSEIPNSYGIRQSVTPFRQPSKSVTPIPKSACREYFVSLHNSWSAAPISRKACIEFILLMFTKYFPDQKNIYRLFHWERHRLVWFLESERRRFRDRRVSFAGLLHRRVLLGGHRRSRSILLHDPPFPCKARTNVLEPFFYQA